MTAFVILNWEALCDDVTEGSKLLLTSHIVFPIFSPKGLTLFI